MDLQECREKLDVIDKKIVELFEERMAVSEEVARYKEEHGLLVLDESREKQKLESVRSLVKEKSNKEATAQLFEKIMELSRARQEQIL